MLSFKSFPLLYSCGLWNRSAAVILILISLCITLSSAYLEHQPIPSKGSYSSSLPSSSLKDVANIQSRPMDPSAASYLAASLSAQLDFCSGFSLSAISPSCRHRYSSWVWDDPNTNISPDSIFILGGFLGPDDGFETPFNASIASDFWVLSWTYGGSPAIISYTWTCLQGCALFDTLPTPRADATSWATPGALYVYGGYGPPSSSNSTNYTCLSDLWAFNISTQSWQIFTISPAGYKRSVASQLGSESSSIHIMTHVKANPSNTMPPLAGATAWYYVTDGYEAVYIVGGTNNGVPSTGAYSILFTNYDSFSISSSNLFPPSRSGGLGITVELGNSFMFLLAGGYNETTSFTDLWGFVPNLGWYNVCLYVRPYNCYSLSDPTTQLLCSLCGLESNSSTSTINRRYATFLSISHTGGISNILAAGQVASPSVRTTSARATEAVVWSDIPAWFVLSGASLPLITIIHHGAECTQPNPCPSNPYMFFCSNGDWSATGVYSIASIDSQIVLSPGPPINIVGDWNPDALLLDFQVGAYLNISGVLQVPENFTTNLYLNDDQFDNFASHGQTVFIPVIETLNSSFSSNVTLANPILFSKTAYVNSPSCIKTIAFTSWSIQQKQTGRQVFNVQIDWMTKNDCNPPPSSLAIIVGASVGGSVALMIVIAVFIVVIILPRIRKSHHGKNEDDTELPTMMEKPSTLPVSNQSELPQEPAISPTALSNSMSFFSNHTESSHVYPPERPRSFKGTSLGQSLLSPPQISARVNRFPTIHSNVNSVTSGHFAHDAALSEMIQEEAAMASALEILIPGNVASGEDISESSSRYRLSGQIMPNSARSSDLEFESGLGSPETSEEYPTDIANLPDLNRI